jgi:hypothetical protein
VVCGAGGCIDGIVEKLIPQLPKDYPCNASATYMSDCLQPFIGPLSAAGANLMALVACDQAVIGARLVGKVPCVGPPAAAAVPAAAAALKTKQ